MKKIFCISLLFFSLFLASCGEEKLDFKSMSNDELINYAMTGDASSEDIMEIMGTMDYCDVDTDCEAFYGVCPLGCHMAVNKSNLTAAQAVMNSWKNIQGDSCVYDCVGIKGAACQSGKCVAIAEDIPGGEQNGTGQTNSIQYQDDSMIVKGVGPDISLEPTVGADVLVLHKTYEDHSDHVFIDKNLWESYANGHDITLPGNVVALKGEVVGLDAGAGNRYYQVVSIENLKKVADPTIEDINALLDIYHYCEADTDCDSFYGECPFSCHQYINKKYSQTAKDIMTNYINGMDDKCVYKCTELKPVKCENYKCMAQE